MFRPRNRVSRGCGRVFSESNGIQLHAIVSPGRGRCRLFIGRGVPSLRSRGRRTGRLFLEKSIFQINPSMNPDPDCTLALKRFCVDNSLAWDDLRAEQLSKYFALLRKFNRTMNLVGPLSGQQMVDDLLVDSAAAAAVVRPHGRMLDVGSGAGLPGIVLHILGDAVETTLVEPRLKRARFLRIAAHRLGLQGVEIQEMSIEKLEAEPFDYVISKAFQPPVTWLQTGASWLRQGGHLVCMARPEDRSGLQEEAQSLKLEEVAGVSDVSALGAVRRDRPRSVFVFSHVS